MSQDERATITTLRRYREVFREHIAANGGRVVDMAGDSVLAVFDSAQGAVRAAAATQGALAQRNQGLPEARRMLFRIGVNLGDIEEADDGTVYGDGVNVAARLESLAEPGGVMVSEFTYHQVRRIPELTFSDAGRHVVKNIPDAVRVYRVRLSSERMTDLVSRGARRRKLVVVIATAIVLLTLGGGVLWLSVGHHLPWTVSTEREKMRPSIAVLPFTNLSGEAEHEYFADGISDDLITELSRFEGLLVIAGTSTSQFKAQVVDVGEVAAALGVRYVLQGGVRRGGDRVRVTAKLIDAETGAYLWGERYDREIADVFAVQDEVTDQIIAALKSELVDANTTRARRSLTNSHEAYHLYLRGRAYNENRTRESNTRARELFETAIDLDKDFAAAYAEFADALWLAAWYGWDDSTVVLDEAVAAARKAIALDPSLPQGYARLAAPLAFQGRVEEGIVAARRAVALDTNYATGYARLSYLLSMNSEFEAAIAAADVAMKLDPYSPIPLFMRGAAHFYSGHYEQAVTDLQQSLELSPDFAASHQILAAAYGWLGDETAARVQAAEVLRLSPNFVEILFRAPFRHRDVRMRLVEGLRKAGLDVPDPPSEE